MVSIDHIHFSMSDLNGFPTCDLNEFQAFWRRGAAARTLDNTREGIVSKEKCSESGLKMINCVFLVNYGELEAQSTLIRTAIKK